MKTYLLNFNDGKITAKLEIPLGELPKVSRLINKWLIDNGIVTHYTETVNGSDASDGN